MSSQYYYSQNAHPTMPPPNNGFQQNGTVYTTQPSTIPSHQLPTITNSGQIITQAPSNIHVIPAHHHYQPQIITHQQIIQPQSQNLSSPIYSPATTIQSGQSLVAHTTRQQSNPSLLSASINGTTRFIENGTVTQVATTPLQNSIHPTQSRVQVSPQPIIVSSTSNTYTLENGQHVTLQQTPHQPYYTNLPQGTVLHQTVAYSQPTSTAQVPTQAHHFRHSIPTQTIQVVHTNPSSTHPVQHNRIIQAEPRTIYHQPTHPSTRSSLHFQREEVKYVPVVTSLKSPVTQQTTSFTPIQVPLTSTHQVHSYNVDEEKQIKPQYVTTVHPPLYVGSQPSNTPLNQSNRLSVYAICRENSSQDTISPITPVSVEEFDSPQQPSFSSSFQRMRLDEKNLDDHHVFKPVPSASIKNNDMFAKPSTGASKLKMTLDSQSVMVEKDESAETMDFNYYPANQKEGGVSDEYDHPSASEGKRSCSECRRVHKRCSKERPCLRCVRLGKKCVDLPEKKRGRPKKIDKVRQMNNTLSSATPSSVSSVSSNSSPSLLKMSLASIGSQSSLSSFGATPISTSSSLSDSLGSSFNSQVSSVSSVGNYLGNQQKTDPQSKEVVLPSFSNLMQELDIRDSFSRQNLNNKL